MTAEKAHASESYSSFLGAPLPAFVVVQISNRLRFVCWLTLGMLVFFVPSFLFGTYNQTMKGRFPLADMGMLMGMVMAVVFSTLLLVLLRRERTSRQTVILSVLYENLMAFAIALHDGFWAYPEPYNPEPKVFWSCLWLLIYPVIVPYSPRTSIVSSLLSVGMVMLALASPLWIARESLPPAVVFKMALETHLVCALAAYLISRLINHLNWQLAKEKQKASYQLIKPLGEGSMGEVWLARHRVLRRPAAMKIIQRDRLLVADKATRQEVLQRFEREAQATALLYNPHSIVLYDFGTTEDGSFFYVMEALDGMDLQKFIRQFGPLPQHRVVYLLKQLAESLSEAHARGLIHRDLKPANVFVCRYGVETDFIKVLDFGMVKYQKEISETMHRLSRVAVSKNIELTTDGQLTGTPTYMAPEMIRGQHVDHRYDVYAFGGIAYYLLTGTRVFPEEGMESQLMAQLEQEPEPPSQRARMEFHPGLEGLILQCLRKKPEERPEGMEEIHRRLNHLIFPEEWTSENARAWWEMNLPERADSRASNSIASIPRDAKPPKSGAVEETLPTVLMVDHGEK
ncbi:MAG: serine/threonine-protein kinase [Candidatus Sumerlaeia bacterium]|nr:serine/threonine-protein kinase [Candidatus Sumerlaeia bacterium]